MSYLSVLIIVTDGNSFPSLRGDKGCVKASYRAEL